MSSVKVPNDTPRQMSLFAVDAERSPGSDEVTAKNPKKLFAEVNKLMIVGFSSWEVCRVSRVSKRFDRRTMGNITATVGWPIHSRSQRRTPTGQRCTL